MDSIYDQLLQLPLLQGVGRERIAEVVEKIRLSFVKYEQGAIISFMDDECSDLRFVLSGRVRLDTNFLNNRVTLSQVVSAPDVIGAEYFFGLNTTYPYTITAASDCSFMEVSKKEYMRILAADRIFLLNMLNYTSRLAQKGQSALMAMRHNSVEERLAFIVHMFTSKRAEQIRVIFKQRELGWMLGAKRTQLVATLHAMAEQGIIALTDSTIDIVDRDALMSVLHR